MNKQKLIEAGKKALYCTLRTIATPVASLLFPFMTPETHALSQRKGPFIIYCNHISMLDPFIVGSMILPRKAYFMAKSELMQAKAVFPMLRLLGAIPVHRGETDLKAIHESMNALKQGDVFVIFPEGTRNKARNDTLLPFFSGISLIALRAGVPIIPVYIENQGAYKPFRRLRVHVGEELSLEDIRAMKITSSQKLAAATARMREKMELLMPVKAG